MQTILPGRPFQRVAMDILGPFEKQLRKSSVDSIGLDGKETLKTGAEPVKTVPSQSRRAPMQTILPGRPGWKRDTEDWCRTCENCQTRTDANYITDHFKEWRWTFLDHSQIPKTERVNKYILVIGDYFTKWMEAIPIPDMEATTVSRKFVDNFICQFGCPDQIHTDNFESMLFKDICRLLIHSISCLDEKPDYQLM